MEAITVKEAQEAFSKALSDLGVSTNQISNQVSTNGNGNGSVYMNGVDDPIVQYTTDLDDPGKELSEGQDCRVSIQEMAHLERIIEENNLLPVHFLEEGAIVQRAVARVNLGRSFGSGFLVSPTLFITNNHVIRNAASAKTAKFEFNYQQDKDGNNQTIDSFVANPDAVFHTNVALDYTIVRLKSKSIFRFPLPNLVASEMGVSNVVANVPGVMANGNLVNRINRFFVNPGSRWGYLTLKNSNYAVDQHVNIVQHPRALRKQVALQDNEITNIFTNHLRYTTDTEPGSSGSPVFNNAWDLIGLHHAAGARSSSGQWLNNQGVRMDKIITDLRNHFAGQPNGQQILNELGI